MLSLCVCVCFSIYFFHLHSIVKCRKKEETVTNFAIVATVCCVSSCVLSRPLASAAVMLEKWKPIVCVKWSVCAMIHQLKKPCRQNEWKEEKNKWRSRPSPSCKFWISFCSTKKPLFPSRTNYFVYQNL